MQNNAPNREQGVVHPTFRRSCFSLHLSLQLRPIVFLRSRSITSRSSVSWDCTCLCSPNGANIICCSRGKANIKPPPWLTLLFWFYIMFVDSAQRLAALAFSLWRWSVEEQTHQGRPRLWMKRNAWISSHQPMLLVTWRILVMTSWKLRPVE